MKGKICVFRIEKRCTRLKSHSVMILTTLRHDVPDLTAFRIKYRKHHECTVTATESETHRKKNKQPTNNKQPVHSRWFFVSNFSNHHRFSVFLNFIYYLCTGCSQPLRANDGMFHGSFKQNTMRIKCARQSHRITLCPVTVLSLYFFFRFCLVC